MLKNKFENVVHLVSGLTGRFNVGITGWITKVCRIIDFALGVSPTCDPCSVRMSVLETLPCQIESSKAKTTECKSKLWNPSSAILIVKSS
jgi:hypothetical protein